MLIEYLADHEALVPELGLLHFAEWGYLHPGETLEEHAKRLAACCGRNEIPTVVVALSDCEPLGSAMLLSSDMDTRPDLTPWLAGLYVVEQHRGEGIGSALVERIVAEAAGLGLPRLYLYTSIAESLYTRLGFSVLDRCDYHGERVAVMVRDLRASQRTNLARSHSRTKRGGRDDSLSSSRPSITTSFRCGIPQTE